MQEKELKHIEEEKQGEVLVIDDSNGKEKSLYLESYGCAMNFSDSEIVASIMSENGYKTTKIADEADLILINTCSIRDKAEQTVKKRLEYYNSTRLENPNRVVGLLGCMAERLKSKLLEDWKLVDLVVGPDAYRDLPNLVEEVADGRKAVNVILSKEETYADIKPVRLGSNGVTAFVSIMRGCDNMCSFCVVPFTRGRERSRDPESICEEVRQLAAQGYREVTLLGQNVDSYLWFGGGAKKDFKKLPEEEQKDAVKFSELLEKVALVDPRVRIRFSTSHPKDMGDDVLYAMTRHKNICDYVHLPVQSGSDRILELMNRGYTSEWYKERIDAIRRIIPGCGISQDIISGFCSETEEDHKDTLALMDYVKYDFGYMYMYSERPNTAAEKKFIDDVPDEVKSRRLSEIISKQKKHAVEMLQRHVGKVQEVLIEGDSKRSQTQWAGRNSQNAMVVFDKNGEKPGDYVMVEIQSSTGATLIGKRKDS